MLKVVPSANSAAEIDMSAGLFNDGPAGDEAEAGALAAGFSREKRLE